MERIGVFDFEFRESAEPYRCAFGPSGTNAGESKYFAGISCSAHGDSTIVKRYHLARPAILAVIGSEGASMFAISQTRRRSGGAEFPQIARELGKMTGHALFGEAASPDLDSLTWETHKAGVFRISPTPSKRLRGQKGLAGERQSVQKMSRQLRRKTRSVCGYSNARRAERVPPNPQEYLWQHVQENHYRPPRQLHPLANERDAPTNLARPQPEKIARDIQAKIFQLRRQALDDRAVSSRSIVQKAENVIPQGGKDCRRAAWCQLEVREGAASNRNQPIPNCPANFHRHFGRDDIQVSIARCATGFRPRSILRRLPELRVEGSQLALAWKAQKIPTRLERR